MIKDLQNQFDQSKHWNKENMGMYNMETVSNITPSTLLRLSAISSLWDKYKEMCKWKCWQPLYTSPMNTAAIMKENYWLQWLSRSCKCLITLLSLVVSIVHFGGYKWIQHNHLFWLSDRTSVVDLHYWFVDNISFILKTVSEILLSTKIALELGPSTNKFTSAESWKVWWLGRSFHQLFLKIRE